MEMRIAKECSRAVLCAVCCSCDIVRAAIGIANFMRTQMESEKKRRRRSGRVCIVLSRLLFLHKIVYRFASIRQMLLHARTAGCRCWALMQIFFDVKLNKFLRRNIMCSAHCASQCSQFSNTIFCCFFLLVHLLLLPFLILSSFPSTVSGSRSNDEVS